MNTLFRNLLISLAAALSLNSANAAPIDDYPCIPEGEWRTYCRVIDMTGEGMPIGATISPESVGAYDWDWGSNDSIGGATFNPATNQICVTIRNDGGILKDVNGNAHSGGSEGPCIELFFRYTLIYTVQRCTGGGGVHGDVSIGESGSVGGSLGGGTTCWDEYEHDWRTTESFQVCAC